MFLPNYRYFFIAANINHTEHHSKAFYGEKWWGENDLVMGDMTLRVRYEDRRFMDGMISTLTVENKNVKLIYRVINTSILEPVLPCGVFVRYKTGKGSDDLMMLLLLLPQ